MEIYYNLEQLEEISEGNDSFVEKMVNMFINITPELINTMKAALINEDFDLLKATAHKMKPSIDMMGINSLKQEIRMLNQLAMEKADILEIKKYLDFVELRLAEVISQLKDWKSAS